jgi:hypothetical protein
LSGHKTNNDTPTYTLAKKNIFIHLESLFPFIAISRTSADGEQWQRAQCFLCSGSCKQNGMLLALLGSAFEACVPRGYAMVRA